MKYIIAIVLVLCFTSVAFAHPPVIYGPVPPVQTIVVPQPPLVVQTVPLPSYYIKTFWTPLGRIFRPWVPVYAQPVPMYPQPQPQPQPQPTMQRQIDEIRDMVRELKDRK